MSGRLIPLVAAAAWQAFALQPIPRFPIRAGPLTITRAVEAGKPFTVAGGNRARLFRFVLVLVATPCVCRDLYPAERSATSCYGSKLPRRNIVPGHV